MGWGEILGILQKKPQWSPIVIANVTPVGLGVLGQVPIAFTYPGILAVNVDITNYVAADTAIITLEKSMDGANAIAIGIINIVAGVVDELLGYPYNKIAAIVPGDIPGVEWIISYNPAQLLTLNVTQTVGVVRQLNYSYAHFGPRKMP